VVISLRQSPHLVRGQTKITEHLPEGVALVDGVEELLPYVGGKPLLRSAPLACPGGVTLEFAASAATSCVPPCHRAVCCTITAASTVWIGQVTHLVQLPRCPRRLRNQSKGTPAPDHGRRYVAHGSRLAD
jgi:hypothetical protein